MKSSSSHEKIDFEKHVSTKSDAAVSDHRFDHGGVGQFLACVRESGAAFYAGRPRAFVCGSAHSVFVFAGGQSVSGTAQLVAV